MADGKSKGFGCIACTVLTVILISGTIAAIFLGLGYHKISQGSVGVYFVAGALSDQITQPGLHYANPVWTTVKEISILSRTDTLPGISTVTKDGIENKFHDVQVITSIKETEVIRLLKKFGLSFHKTLVQDRIYEEIRLFCANHTVDEVYSTKFLDMVAFVEENVNHTIAELGQGGIVLHHLTIPKPDIPHDIAENYQAVKVQWTEQLVAKQRQETEKIKKETEQVKAVADAERKKDVLEIELQKQMLQKEGEQKLSDLENKILAARRKNIADLEKYEKEQRAEANKLLYANKGFVQLELAKSLSDNTKFFFSGDGSPIGALLTKILTKE